MKILLPIFLIAAISNWITEAKIRFFVIRNPKTGLVLEQAGDSGVHLQPFTGYDPQLWTLKKVSNGKNIIINEKNGKVLDVLEHTSTVIVSRRKGRRGSPTQRWYVNSDNTIINGDGNKFALDISEYDEETHSVGVPLRIKLKRSGDSYQKFIFQYV